MCHKAAEVKNSVKLNILKIHYYSTINTLNPPSFYSQLISFHLRALDIRLQQVTKKKGQHDYNEKEKTPLQLMAVKTPMSFLRARYLKCNWLGRHLTSSL